MKLIKACLSVGFLATALASCSLPTVAPAVLSGNSLDEPLDAFNASLWQKADWTNGGFFNCGWLPDHASFSDGKLVVTLDDTDSHGKTYSSGEYRTIDKYGFGRYEVSMKAAAATGTVSSFFTYTNDPVWDEIDFEILGQNPNQVQLNFFVNGVGNHEKLINLGFDSSAAFHKYAFEYGSASIKWYVDDVMVWEVNANTGLNIAVGTAMPSHDMQIMVNLWPGDSADPSTVAWLGTFAYGGPLQASYDYIKYTP